MTIWVLGEWAHYQELTTNMQVQHKLTIWVLTTPPLHLTHAQIWAHWRSDDGYGLSSTTAAAGRVESQTSHQSSKHKKQCLFYVREIIGPKACFVYVWCVYWLLLHDSCDTIQLYLLNNLTRMLYRCTSSMTSYKLVTNSHKYIYNEERGPVPQCG